MEIKEIIELMRAVSENGLTSFKIEEGNLKLSIKKECRPQQIVAVAPAVQTAQMAQMAAPSMAGMPGNTVIADPAAQLGNAARLANPGQLTAAGQFDGSAPYQTSAPSDIPALQNAAQGAAAQTTPGLSPAIDSDKVIASPLVGTFYNSPSPDAEVFVKVGDTVKKGQTLGIIEAMKLMNEIESEYDGIIEAVLVGNEEVVEYGQPLFRIR